MNPKENRELVLKLRFMAVLPEGLKNKVADTLLAISKPRSVPKGGAWIREGEVTKNKGYILLAGRVGIRKSNAPEAVCEAPELLGEIMQFSEAGARTATVVTLEDCTVLRFMWDDFWSTIESKVSPKEQIDVKQAIESLAWQHFAE